MLQPLTVETITPLDPLVRYTEFFIYVPIIACCDRITTYHPILTLMVLWCCGPHIGSDAQVMMAMIASSNDDCDAPLTC